MVSSGCFITRGNAGENPLCHIVRRKVGLASSGSKSVCLCKKKNYRYIKLLRSVGMSRYDCVIYMA